MNELKAELQRLYSDASKHSVYQNVPDFVSAELGYTETIDESWRGDRPRLAYLETRRTPKAGERWMDFGANTGFFTLSLARHFPETQFTAIEANPNHAQFIDRISQYFGMENVEVIQQAVGLEDLSELPTSDFMLHLNVLHHAGHDFDASLVPNKSEFGQYAQHYLTRLRKRTNSMLFQMGSNWGGDKAKPLIESRHDMEKLVTFYGWLRSAHWNLSEIAYPTRDGTGRVCYVDVSKYVRQKLGNSSELNDINSDNSDVFGLEQFLGEFYRRPLFLCT